MRLCVFTRLLTAAATVFLAAPAFGQADLQVLSVTATGGVSVGVAKTFKANLVNNGPSHIDKITVDATLTQPAAPYNTAKLGSLTVTVATPAGAATYACVPVTAGTKVPCVATLTATILSTKTATVNVPVTVPVPNTAGILPTAPAECPSVMTAGTADVGVTVNITSVQQAGAEVDGNMANNTGTHSQTVNDWTDIYIPSSTGTPNASEGGTVDYSVTVTNAGPCPATTVFGDFTAPATLTFVSATGCLNNASFAADAGCDLGATLAAGASATYSSTWTVNKFPKEVTKATTPVSFDVVIDQDVVNGPDMNAPTHLTSGSLFTTIDLSGNEGCSTGGAGTLLGLLSLAALRFGRRRSK